YAQCGYCAFHISNIYLSMYVHMQLCIYTKIYVLTYIHMQSTCTYVEIHYGGALKRDHSNQSQQIRCNTRLRMNGRAISKAPNYPDYVSRLPSSVSIRNIVKN